MIADTIKQECRNLQILAVQADDWTFKGLVQLLDPFGAGLFSVTAPHEAESFFPPDCAPDVILISARREKTKMVEDIQFLRAQFPFAPLFVMAPQASDEWIIQAILRAGASGILLKDMTGEQLLAAFRQAFAGLTVLPLPVAYPLVSSGAASRAVIRRDAPLPENLSPKEWQILERLILGLTNKEIAQEFGIAEGTVKVHLRSILQKTKKRNRTEAALWALNVMQSSAEKHLSRAAHS